MRPHTTVQICPRCGEVGVPTLSSGTGPHTVKATCSHCGAFIKWLSLLAPAERMARQMKARLEAMQKKAPSAAQLSYLQALGDTEAPPQTMAEASERIEALKQQTPRRRTEAQGDVQEHIDRKKLL